MTNPSSPEQPDYWDVQYQRGDTRWDIGKPAPAFVDLLAGPDPPLPGRMIVLGCGRGHDALLFARAGFDVLGIDFAPTALAAARAAAQAAGLAVRFEQHDLFDLPATWDGMFDYVLEHTCVSALPPARRPAYVAVVQRLLRPGGRYIALFFTHGQAGCHSISAPPRFRPCSAPPSPLTPSARPRAQSRAAATRKRSP